MHFVRSKSGVRPQSIAARAGVDSEEGVCGAAQHIQHSGECSNDRGRRVHHVVEKAEHKAVVRANLCARYPLPVRLVNIKRSVAQKREVKGG